MRDIDITNSKKIVDRNKTMNKKPMVKVAQLVEHSVVVRKAAGAVPVFHPN